PPSPPPLSPLSLHDALPIFRLVPRLQPRVQLLPHRVRPLPRAERLDVDVDPPPGAEHQQVQGEPADPRQEPVREERLTAPGPPRSEEHTSELQSRSDLVCRL